MLIIMLLVIINLNKSHQRTTRTKLDEYLLVCIVFIVAAVLEYAVVLALLELHKYEEVKVLCNFSYQFQDEDKRQGDL